MPTSKIPYKGQSEALADETVSQSPDFRLLIDSAPALIHTVLLDENPTSSIQVGSN